MTAGDRQVTAWESECGGGSVSCSQLAARESSAEAALTLNEQCLCLGFLPSSSAGESLGPELLSRFSLPCSFQVNLCYLCQACTSLLHSRKMLQHYLQVRMGTLGQVAGWGAPGLATGSQQCQDLHFCTENVPGAARARRCGL